MSAAFFLFLLVLFCGFFNTINSFYLLDDAPFHPEVAEEAPDEVLADADVPPPLELSHFVKDLLYSNKAFRYITSNSDLLKSPKMSTHLE